MEWTLNSFWTTVYKHLSEATTKWTLNVKRPTQTRTSFSMALTWSLPESLLSSSLEKNTKKVSDQLRVVRLSLQSLIWDSYCNQATVIFQSHFWQITWNGTDKVTNATRWLKSTPTTYRAHTSQTDAKPASIFPRQVTGKTVNQSVIYSTYQGLDQKDIHWCFCDLARENACRLGIGYYSMLCSTVKGFWENFVEFWILESAFSLLASHAGVFRGARFSSLSASVGGY